MRMYAVVACSACRRPWLIEVRHATVTCPACGRKADVARRTRLWQGADAAEARAAAATLRQRLAPGGPDAAVGGSSSAGRALSMGAAQPPWAADRPVRHDDPLDAAAAQGRAVRNLGERAEVVARWLTRLVGDVEHETFIDALGRAGLDNERAEKETVRMLACDVVFEPRAGWYRALDP